MWAILGKYMSLYSVCSLCGSKWTMVWLWISVKLSFSLHHGCCLQTAQDSNGSQTQSLLYGLSGSYCMIIPLFSCEMFHRPLALTVLWSVFRKFKASAYVSALTFSWYGGPVISKSTDAWDLYQADLCVRVMSEMAICFLLSVSVLSPSEEICGLFSKCDPLHREEAKDCLHSWT